MFDFNLAAGGSGLSKTTYGSQGLANNQKDGEKKINAGHAVKTVTLAPQNPHRLWLFALFYKW